MKVMNTTINKINDTTMNLDVRELTKRLIANPTKLFRAVFTKKDGSLRNMTFSLAANWNPLNGITTTKSGRQMVETKCANGMATVCEFLGDGNFQPRTLNLTKVISLEML